MVEVERLLCNSQFCDLEQRGASLRLRMAALAREAEVDDLELEDQADALREELLVLSAGLKQAGIDVTEMLNHLLREPATRDLIRRMTSRVESLRRRLFDLPKPSLDLKSQLQEFDLNAIKLQEFDPDATYHTSVCLGQGWKSELLNHGIIMCGKTVWPLHTHIL